MVTKAKKALLASLAAFLCVMLTVFGLSMSVSTAKIAKADDTTVVAKIGETKYAKLSDAVTAAAEGDTVTLLADATEDVVVDKNITLDLGGKTLTGTNSGKATLSIQNGATTTVKNGSIVGSNSYYTIEIIKGSNATATFESLNATAGNTGSSMIDNWGTLTINSGTYTGGLNVVKSEENSTLVINDGKFTLEDCPSSGYTAVILVYGDTTINGGEFIQNANRKWANPQVVMTGVVEGAKAPITRVTGGTFTNNSGKTNDIFHGYGEATSDNFEVSGGTFNKPISEGYCAEGFIPSTTKNADGTYGVKEGKYVAKVGSKNYETLAAAIRLAAKGKTVTLLDNIDGNFEISNNKSITLDLNGFTLNGGTGTAKAAITNHGTLTITDSSEAKTGTIKRDDSGTVGETSYYVIQNLGTMTIEQANVVNNSGYRETNPSGSMVGSSLICNGDNDEGATLTIKGGKLTQRNFIAIKNGANGTLVVNGGEITSNHSAIQNWFNAELTGGTIRGQLWTDAWKEGESVGNTVIGGNVKFTGEIVMDVYGSIKPELTINGGNLSVTNWKVTTACAALGGKPAVQGGTFTNAVPVEYCAEGFIPTKNTDGTFGVKVGTYVAKIGEAGYETLAEAIAAANDGETVTLLADCSGNGIQIKGNTFKTKGLIVDFGGHTYTVGGVLVGSAGTGTNAFQLLAGNKITFQNGTIAGVSENTKPAEDTPNWHGAPAMVIQNYCDLTLEKMTISGGEETVYTMSNNCGNVVIEDSTINAGGAKGYAYGPFAFDVCGYSSYPSVTVTVKGTSVINGDIEFSASAGHTGNVKLNLAGGTINGSLVYGGGFNADIFEITKSDDVDIAAPAGYVWNSEGVLKIAVAKIGEKNYATLQAAFDAAKSGNTVKLLADTKENVVVNRVYELTFDLNGFTLNGGTEKGKPALTLNNKHLTIKDSSADQTGTIMREDTAENSGVSSHYVIDIQGEYGVLTFESGNVINHSGNKDRGASLVRVGNDSVKVYPTLNIKGGTFTQDNFIVIKVDCGFFYLNGGTLNSKNDYAIENWKSATVKGGTVNGTVSSWTYSDGSSSTLTVSGGTINGDVQSVSYDGAAGKLAKVSITGGTVTGTLSNKVYNKPGDADKAKATIEVTGGTFSADPSKYVVESSAITTNDDGTFGVAKAYLAKVGETSYYTMDEAFKAQTTSGETIVMLRDYTTGSTFNSGSINRVVDLNGHTWTCTITDMNSAAFEINYADVTLTVKNGKIISNSLVGLIPTAMGGTIKYDKAGLVFEKVEMTANGHSGIETNGDNTNDSVTLKDSTLNVPNGFGIYFPSSGTLTINNSTINAKTMGVQVCSGKLNINAGSAITVTGDSVPKAENDGAIQDGAAISIVNRPGYKGLSNIVITGGTFTAKAGNDAIKAYDWNNAEKTESAFTKADLVAVSGGTFSSEVNKDYLAKGYRLTKTGESYGVTAKYIESTHVSLGTALSFSYKLRALNNGETIKNAKASYRTVRGNLVEIDMTLVDGYYVFDGITPQMLDRKISVNVYVGDTVVYDVVDYSILDYLQDLLKTDLGTKATVTKQLVADLAFYGKAAMKYVGYTTAVVDKFIADNGLTQSTGDITGVAKSSGTEKVANVSVQFASQNKILIGVAESVFKDYSYTIKVNGTEIDKALWQTDVVDGYRVYVSDGFAASYITDENHYVEVEVLKNGASVQKVQCNVAGYCMKMAENAKMGELAKATYYYGVSAAKYVAIIKG